MQKDAKDLVAPTINDIKNFLKNEWKKWKSETNDPVCRHWIRTVFKLEIAEEQLLQEIEGKVAPWLIFLFF